LKKKRGTGRPAGSESTRADILREAREAFGADGFDGVSLRSVAAKAKVDPSTVIHFFSTKEGLFEAVARDFAPMLKPLIEAMQRRSPGVELARLYLQMWEEKENGATMRALIRTSFGSERASRLFRSVIVEEVLRSLRSKSPIGAELAMTHLIGIGLGRHIMRLPELSLAEIDAIAEKIGPTLDSYLGL
jgi:AcrR family transcriptional regulator